MHCIKYSDILKIKFFVFLIFFCHKHKQLNNLSIYFQFTESLHIQFVEEKKCDQNNEYSTKTCFIFCCPICMEIVKIAESTKLLKNGSDSNYFITSNVVRHLHRVHLKD